MSNFISTILQTEITCVPKIINRYAGKYFNNTLCNGMLWLFCIWTLLHFFFDKMILGILKKMKYPAYIRHRLKKSIWNIGFYSACILYCLATLILNRTDIFNTHHTYILSNSDYIPSQLIMGFLILSSFFTHATVWELCNNGFNFLALDYFILTMFMVWSYNIRWMELIFSLTIVVSLQQLTLEITRTIFNLKERIIISARVHKLLLLYLFYGLLGVNIISHLLIMPLYFIIPIGNSLMHKNDVSLIILNVILWSWIAIEIYISPSLRLMQHYICHVSGPESISRNDRCNDYIECVLYLPRTDTMYKIQLLKAEIQENKAKLDKKKRPKKTMLVQTLKCVMAIKRKLNRQQIVVDKIAAAGLELANQNVDLSEGSSDLQKHEPSLFNYCPEINVTSEVDSLIDSRIEPFEYTNGIETHEKEDMEKTVNKEEDIEN